MIARIVEVLHPEQVWLFGMPGARRGARGQRLGLHGLRGLSAAAMREPTSGPGLAALYQTTAAVDDLSLGHPVPVGDKPRVTWLGGRSGTATLWRHSPDRAAPAPPLFAHLPVHGEIRVEWEPRSALFNTDGQIFSDLGIPVVLLMENYDISRKGYHDTHDTMENIDLDYCAALTAIAIETVADTACSASIQEP